MERTPDQPIETNALPEEQKNMLKREEGDTGTYKPTTTAANYDPTNSQNNQNQQYLRPDNTYTSPDDNRSEGYTYKSDQDFVMQHKAEQKDREAEALRANSPTIGRAHERDIADPNGPDNERRAAVGPEGTGKDEL